MSGGVGRRRGPLDPVDCILCLVHGRIQQVAGRLDLEARVLAKAAELVAKWPSRTNVFVESYDYVEGLLGVRDYYAERKRELNRAAMDYAARVDIPSSAAEAIQFMAAANGIDISMPQYSPRVEKLLRGLGEKPCSCGLGDRELEDMTSTASRLVIVLDNAGEAVFDILAGGRIAEAYGLELVLVARSEPYEIDVTEAEARRLASLLGVRASVVGTGSRLPAFHPTASREARRVVDSPDSMVVVKGIANLEAYMDYWSLYRNHRMVFALRAKCSPLARFFGVALAEPVLASPAWIRERLQSP